MQQTKLINTKRSLRSILWDMCQRNHGSWVEMKQMSAFVWSLPSFLPDSTLHACGKEKKFLVSLSHAATHAWGAQDSVESSFWKIWDKFWSWVVVIGRCGTQFWGLNYWSRALVSLILVRGIVFKNKISAFPIASSLGSLRP
jgi:hypothetical protein